MPFRCSSGCWLGLCFLRSAPSPLPYTLKTQRMLPDCHWREEKSGTHSSPGMSRGVLRWKACRLGVKRETDVLRSRYPLATNRSLSAETITSFPLFFGEVMITWTKLCTCTTMPETTSDCALLQNEYTNVVYQGYEVIHFDWDDLVLFHYTLHCQCTRHLSFLES